jgi:hypothetical protein
MPMIVPEYESLKKTRPAIAAKALAIAIATSVAGTRERCEVSTKRGKPGISCCLNTGSSVSMLAT